MINKTPIDWVKNPDGTQGYTWNPITGCLNNCSYCYARKLANTRLKERYLANKNVAPYDSELDYMKYRHNPFYPRFWIERAREEFGSCYAGAIPKGIFVCDMADLFGIGVPEEWTRRILNKIGMSYYREHRFYLLTKQPQNLIKFSPFPDNCWVGVSVTNPEMFNNATYHLAEVAADVKYISLEPLLEQVFKHDEKLFMGGISWAIIGALTGTYKELIEVAHKYPELTLTKGEKWTLQPKIEWVKEIVEACDKAGIPVFLKKNLYDLLMSVPHSDLYWEDMSTLRQEIPVDKEQEE